MTDEWPYYIDDPLVDRAAHRLLMHIDKQVATPTNLAVFGACTCGEWTTPTWDRYAVFEEYDQHMGQVQASAHAEAAASRKATVAELPNALGCPRCEHIVPVSPEDPDASLAEMGTHLRDAHADDPTPVNQLLANVRDVP